MDGACTAKHAVEHEEMMKQMAANSAVGDDEEGSDVVLVIVVIVVALLVIAAVIIAAYYVLRNRRSKTVRVINLDPKGRKGAQPSSGANTSHSMPNIETDDADLPSGRGSAPPGFRKDFYNK